MLVSHDGVPLEGQPALPPGQAPPIEIDDPEHPWLCVLVLVGDTVRSWVNTGHGAGGYHHAAQHAERGLDGPHICLLGVDCGYDPRIHRAPTCVPSRHARRTVPDGVT